MRTINLNFPPPSALRDPRADVLADSSTRTSNGRAAVTPRTPALSPERGSVSRSTPDPEYAQQEDVGLLTVAFAWVFFHGLIVWFWFTEKLSRLFTRHSNKV